MQPQDRTKIGLGLCLLASGLWGGMPLGALARPLGPEGRGSSLGSSAVADNRRSPQSWRQSQWQSQAGSGFDDPAVSGTVLRFESDRESPTPLQFEIPVNGAIAIPPSRTTVLDAAAFGPIQLQSQRASIAGFGRSDRYEWTVEPESQLYLSRSGYQAMAARYQYQQPGGVTRYDLRLFCQTTDLTQPNAVACALNGNGPLFRGDIAATGQLTLAERSAPLYDDPEVSEMALPRIEGVDLRSVRVLAAETAANPALEAAILEVYPDAVTRGNGAPTRYQYNRVDLNDDGRAETLVYLSGPTACGTGGCTALILESEGDRYRLVTQLSLVRPPVIVSEDKTWGWRNLILYVSGGGARPSYRLLRFNGSTYPSNPSIQPELPIPSTVRGTAYLGDRPGGDRSIGDRPNRRGPQGRAVRQAYRRGYELGVLDANQKLGADYRRHRTEFTAETETEFQRGYDNGYRNLADPQSPTDPTDPNASANDYPGKGTLYRYPSTAQATEQRFELTQLRLVPGPNNTGRLTFRNATNNSLTTFEGTLAAETSGQTLTLRAVDGVPAQGVLFIGEDGLVRTRSPIFVGVNDQEISVYFRPER